MNVASLRSSLRQPLCRSCLRQQRRMASDLPAPPLLLKLRGDMKQAMKNKDTTRLNVLRGVLAEVTNASKTSNPLKTDIQLLGLLRKRAQASREIAADAQKGNRADIAERENAQVAVMEEYASSVETMSEDDIKSILQETVGKLRTEGDNPNAGTILKEVFKSGGPFDGKPVDRAQVATLVKGML